MQTALPLEKMTTEEKIQVMESIWDDLCKNEESLPSPLWHGEILQDREEKIKKEDGKYMDLEKAKKHIRDAVS